MSTEKSMLVPGSIAFNAGVSPSPYVQRNIMSMANIEEFVPRLQLPSPRTFHQEYSFRNSKPTDNLHDVKTTALDKAIDIIEERMASDQGLVGGGGAQREHHDTMKQGDSSRVWETVSPSTDNIFGIELVS